MNRISKIFSFPVLIYIVVCLSIFVWICCRSYTLDITNDEAYSYFNVAKQNYKMMIGTANTHWLNSFFIFFEYHLLGTKVWMLRLHSCLSFILFSLFIYKIFRPRLSSSWLILMPLSVVVFSSYLLDFFSLARGYALSIMFQTIAYHFILNKEENEKNKLYIYLFFSLSVFSCYTAILSMLSYFLFDIFELYQKKQLKKYLLSFLPFICTSVLAIPNIFFIRLQGDLEEGQTNGFIQDSLSVFFQRSYEKLLNADTATLLALLLFVGIAIFFYFQKRKIGLKEKQFFIIFFLNVIIIEFLYLFLDIPFCFGRTSLYLNIQILILICFILIFYLQNKFVSIAASAVMLVLSFLYFSLCKNHHTTVEWWKTQGLEKCLSDLDKIQNAKNKKVGMHLAQYGCYKNYYSQLNSYTFNAEVYSFCENKSGTYEPVIIQNILAQDYLIMLKPYQEFLKASEVKVISTYKDMKSDLLEVVKNN